MAAAVNDCFTIGSIVICTTCFQEELEGEVLAFDHNTKMLVIKCRSKKSEDLSDVFVLNLSLCSNVQVVKEQNANFSDEPQKLNLEQLKLRLRKTVQTRQTYLKSQNADVSPEARELYRVIAKQFKFNEVSWQGANIQIFNEVTISPPYRVENVVSTSNNKGLCNYIKKMIEQFISTRSAQGKSSPVTLTGSSPILSSIPTSAPLASVGNTSSVTSSASPVPAN